MSEIQMRVYGINIQGNVVKPLLKEDKVWEKSAKNFLNRTVICNSSANLYNLCMKARYTADEWQQGYTKNMLWDFMKVLFTSRFVKKYENIRCIVIPSENPDIYYAFAEGEEKKERLTEFLLKSVREEIEENKKPEVEVKQINEVQTVNKEISLKEKEVKITKQNIERATKAVLGLSAIAGLGSLFLRTNTSESQVSSYKDIKDKSLFTSNSLRTAGIGLLGFLGGSLVGSLYKTNS